MFIVSDEVLVLLGGRTSNWQALSACYAYDCEDKIIPDLPHATREAAVVDYRDYIYLLGGNDGSQDRASCLRLDKSRLVWDKLADMKGERRWCAAAATDGQILAVGGYCNGYLATVEMYDIMHNSWRQLANYPAGPVVDAAGCAWNGAFYISGGFNGAAYIKTVYRYQPNTGTWDKLPDMSHARYCHSMAAVGDHLYVLGGDGVSSIEMYDETTRQFTVIANMTERKCWTNAVIMDDKILLAAGSDDRLVTFDTSNNTVSEKQMNLRQEYGQSHVALVPR